jgi:hypothetical protein
MELALLVHKDELPKEASDRKVLGEEDLGSKSDVPTEVMPLLASKFERDLQVLRENDAKSDRADRTLISRRVGTYVVKGLHVLDLLLCILVRRTGSLQLLDRVFEADASPIDTQQRSSSAQRDDHRSRHAERLTPSSLP